MDWILISIYSIGSFFNAEIYSGNDKRKDEDCRQYGTVRRMKENFPVECVLIRAELPDTRGKKSGHAVSRDF